ncbi:hypothetical protein B5M42_012685 [Paenibacillus athensensis]|uniref:Uncharacterized protein n=1 Tax=Paenibacillus athensensis TaxID=1967502 RepID=A0A4Y8PYD9_9BACL|nr:glycosyltransferase [Paenibacillus athensensis]MCD1259690.1 hypothetical protein [Paenibacillus athensensis]
MERNPRILILTASYGNGHITAARALRQQLHRQGVTQVTIVDLMKEGHPILHTIAHSLIHTSLQTSRIGLNYYGWSYYWTREARGAAWFQQSTRALGRKKLGELLGQLCPDAVVTTFPFAVSPELCRERGIRNYTVLTDYALHASWLHPGVDGYYVATEELKQQMMLRGIGCERIAVSGIPIMDNGSCARACAPADGEGKTILVMATDKGAAGYAAEMIHALSGIAGTRIHVVCGHQDKLRLKLDARFAEAGNVYVDGFVDNLPERMEQASCLVTKAGGLTLSEAIALELPLYIYRPYAGQERENARYLAGRGAARVHQELGELTADIAAFLQQPRMQQNARMRLQAIQKPDAAASIVQDLLGKLASPPRYMPEDQTAALQAALPDFGSMLPNVR